MVYVNGELNQIVICEDCGAGVVKGHMEAYGCPECEALYQDELSRIRNLPELQMINLGPLEISWLAPDERDTPSEMVRIYLQGSESWFTCTPRDLGQFVQKVHLFQGGCSIAESEDM